MTSLELDTTERCVCGRTDGLVRGWCAEHLPGAIDGLMQWAQDRDDVAHDALSRLDGIAEIASRGYEALTPHDIGRIAVLAGAGSGELILRPRVVDDQPILPMPTHCDLWDCHRGGEPAPLKANERGFMECTRCRSSWGKP